MHNKNILSIDYDSLTVTAMRDLVKKVLNQVSENGLPDKHHFYITFITHFMGVTMPDIIKNKYPDEITIGEITSEILEWYDNSGKKQFFKRVSLDGFLSKERKKQKNHEKT